MFEIAKLHHVAIPVHDFARTQAFYVDVLGLRAHPEKSNWLRAGDGFSVHLMKSDHAPGAASVVRHFALQVTSLRDLVAHLLDNGLAPYQASLEGDTHPVTHPNDPLDFGLGTVFITDPENNTIEFLEKGKGLFAIITD